MRLRPRKKIFGLVLILSCLTFVRCTLVEQNIPETDIDIDAPATITAVYETVVAEVQTRGPEVTPSPVSITSTPIISTPVASPPEVPTPTQPTTHDLITFAGYDWHVKSSEAPVGPGPNIFSNRMEDVFVDQDGRLHLKIAEHNGQFFTTEVINTQSFGYGLYTFYLDTPADHLDPNAILGLFTWDTNAPEENYREIDIEISQWGQEDEDYANSQYVVQPWEKPSNIERFDTPETLSTHQFYWLPDRIIFQSFLGHPTTPSPTEAFHSWVYAGEDIPAPGGENVRINFWLLGGTPPLNGEGSEVIVSNFEFTPWNDQAMIEAPTNIQVQTESPTSLRINWDQVPEAAQYTLFRSHRFDGEFVPIVTTDTNSFLDVDLPENQMFFYMVEAESTFGATSLSSSIAWGVPTDPSQNALFAQFDGNYVTGKVFYENLAENHRVVWWVLTDTWYIQPWLDDFYTPVGEDGTFRRWGHPGNRARIFLVTEGDTSPILRVEVDKSP